MILIDDENQIFVSEKWRLQKQKKIIDICYNCPHFQTGYKTECHLEGKQFVGEDYEQIEKNNFPNFCQLPNIDGNKRQFVILVRIFRKIPNRNSNSKYTCFDCKHLKERIISCVHYKNGECQITWLTVSEEDCKSCTDFELKGHQSIISFLEVVET